MKPISETHPSFKKIIPYKGVQEAYCWNTVQKHTVDKKILNAVLDKHIISEKEAIERANQIGNTTETIIKSIEMSRELKFKGFDGVSLNGPFDVGDDQLEFYTDQGLPVLQYAGLKDKNGVEIYEGDIIQYDDDEKVMNKWVCGEKALVVYEPSRFVLRMKPFDKDEFTNQNVMKQGDCEDVIEVVGNIYENPEILEESK